jgi:mannose/fructose/N-acetylgalactosamine-specific phosphotransferase system component IIC
VSGTVRDGLAAMGVHPSSHESHAIPDLDTLPAPVRAIFEQAFGQATGHLFLVATPFAVAAFVCVLFIREVPLRTTIHRADEIAPEATTQADAR